MNVDQDLAEQGEGEGAPETGTSSDGEKKTGATLWTSGATRGAYQLGVTKWADSYKITRGRANPLWEQVDLNKTFNPSTDTPTKEYTTFWGETISLPTDGSVEVKLWDDDKPRALRFKGAFEDSELKGYIYWPQTYLDPKTKKTFIKNELAPDEDWLKSEFPTNTLRYIHTKKDNRFYGPVLTKTVGTNQWKLNNAYLFNNGSKYIPFDSKNYIHTSVTTSVINWLGDNWVIVGEIAVSVIAGILSGGMSLVVQALIQSGVAIAFAGTAYLISDKTESDKIGLGVGLLIGCLPFIPAATKLGIRGPLKSLAKYGDELANAKTEKEILEVLAKFDEPEKTMVARCLTQIPKAEFEKVIRNQAVIGFADKVRRGEIIVSKIPGSQLRWWKELLVEGGGALPIVAAGWAYESYQARKEDERIINEFIGSIGKGDNQQPENIDNDPLGVLNNTNKNN